MADRLALVSRREAELHYAIRNNANILDHRVSEEEAHHIALRRVEEMHFAEEQLKELVKREGRRTVRG